MEPTDSARSGSPSPVSRPERIPSILLVDDEETIRALEQSRLAAMGYDVVVADGAERALELFRDRGGFALVLTDFQMPVVDGVELAARIADLDSSVPVVMMTGFPAAIGEVPPNVVAVLPKPSTLRELDRTLSRLPL